MLVSLVNSSKSLTQIKQIHAQILLHGLPLQNQLIWKLTHLNFINYARLIFDHTPFPSDFSWNSLIRNYTLQGHPQDSLFLYLKMFRHGKRPTNFTYPFLLKACSALDSVCGGEQLHTHVVKLGFQCDIFVNNSLIDMYCKCGFLSHAHKVLDGMRERDDEVSWNSMVSGYVQWGLVEKAREVFEEMPVRRNVVCWTAILNGYGREGNLVKMVSLFREMLVSDDEVEPNSATMVCLLSACSTLCNFKVGRWVAVFIDVNAVPANEFLRTALIDMYSKCGDMEKAKRLFDNICSKTLASWNAIMTGYVIHGLFEDVIQLYHCMQKEFVKPNEITMVNVLSACAGLGAAELGIELHRYVLNNLEVNVILATTLVDMYSKCGKIDDACLVFVKTSQKDLPLWNAMIMGLAYHGIGRDSLAIFRQMEGAGAQPNDITFIGVLSACNHSGFVQEGRMQFSDMIRKYGLSPQVEHYACMIDLLGRAGHLEEAYELVQNMIVSPDSIIWGALLSACRLHRNLKVVDNIAEIMIASQEPNMGFCILLSNIYASAGRWQDVARMRRLVKEKKIKKPFGCSWIEVDGAIHRFVVEDTTHLKIQEIYETNQILVNHLKVEGYAPIFDFVMRNVDDILTFSPN